MLDEAGKQRREQDAARDLRGAATLPSPAVHPITPTREAEQDDDERDQVADVRAEAAALQPARVAAPRQRAPGDRTVEPLVDELRDVAA